MQTPIPLDEFLHPKREVQGLHADADKLHRLWQDIQEHEATLGGGGKMIKTLAKGIGIGVGIIVFLALVILAWGLFAKWCIFVTEWLGL